MGYRVISLSAGQLIARRKLAGFFEPLHSDAEITCDDGIDLDTLIRQQTDAWYSRMLLTAPLEILPLTDIASQLTMSRTADGAGLVSLPPGTVRVAEVTMEGWLRPAAVITDPASAEALAQINPFSRGTASHPVAVVHPGGRLMLYTPPRQAIRPSSLLAVIQPPEGTYLLTEAMFSQP